LTPAKATEIHLAEQCYRKRYLDLRTARTVDGSPVQGWQVFQPEFWSDCTNAIIVGDLFRVVGEGFDFAITCVAIQPGGGCIMEPFPKRPPNIEAMFESARAERMQEQEARNRQYLGGTK